VRHMIPRGGYRYLPLEKPEAPAARIVFGVGKTTGRPGTKVA
jgi:hypothetical protein